MQGLTAVMAGPGFEPTPPSSQYSSHCASPHQQNLGSVLRTDFRSKTHDKDPEKKSHKIHGTKRVLHTHCGEPELGRRDCVPRVSPGPLLPSGLAMRLASSHLQAQRPRA